MLIEIRLSSDFRMSGFNLKTINKKTSVVFTLLLFFGFMISGTALVVLEYFNKKAILVATHTPNQPSVDEIFQQSLWSMLLVVVISLFISSVAYFFLNKYQKSITNPILELATAASQLSNSKSYSEPEIPDCTDEINTIYHAFADIAASFKDKRNELELSEFRLQEILDNSILSITIKDLGGVLTYSNKYFREFLSRVDHDQKLKIQDLLISKEADAQITKDRQVIETGEPVQYESEITLVDGIHYFHIVKIPLHDEQDKVYSICTISNEVTEVKKQAEYLKRSQKMDALGKLTGGIVHDYNNILAIIIGFAQLIESSAQDNTKVINFAKEIKKTGHRGAKLTSRLLAFSRTKAAEPKNLNISEIISADKQVLKRTLTVRIQLELDLLDELWSVCIDQDDLQDTILNICINAMHAVDTSGQITIKTDNVIIAEEEAVSLTVKAGEYVLIQISDNGSGMDREVLSHIFDPFYSTKGESGSGLGLSQVYGFVKRSDGAIKVESEVERGSKFYIYFPRSYQISSAQDVTDIKVRDDLRGTESILIVDDEDALLEITEETLRNVGYRVSIANSGEKALEILQKDSFHLLFSDIIMPGMSGYELAGEVRKKYPEMKIQLTSGYDSATPADFDDAVLQNNILSKPFGDVRLLKTIRKALDQT